MGLRCAIIGSGNIGTDLMMKIRRSDQLELAAWSASTRPATAWPGRRRLGVEATADGIRWRARSSRTAVDARA